MDAYGHVNHARTVTLVEEARVDLLFVEAARRGITGLADGVVVASLSVDFHSPLVADGGSVLVGIAVRELRAASFLMDYTVHAGRADDSAVVATAQTRMVPYDLAAARPRRLTDAERDFLAAWRAHG